MIRTPDMVVYVMFVLMYSRNSLCIEYGPFGVPLMFIYMYMFGNTPFKLKAARVDGQFKAANSCRSFVRQRPQIHGNPRPNIEKVKINFVEQKI